MPGRMIPSTLPNKTKYISVPRPSVLAALDIAQVLGRGHKINLLWFWTCGELLAVSRVPCLTIPYPEHITCVSKLNLESLSYCNRSKEGDRGIGSCRRDLSIEWFLVITVLYVFTCLSLMNWKLISFQFIACPSPCKFVYRYLSSIELECICFVSENTTTQE